MNLSNVIVKFGLELTFFQKHLIKERSPDK
jgi:hypothetical protein